jgi:predicted RNase H-like HicB family nuclease
LIAWFRGGLLSDRHQPPRKRRLVVHYCSAVLRHQGASLEEALANIREAIELYRETLPPDERDVLLSQEILTTAIEVNA